MNKAGFIVETTEGRRYSANHLSTSHRESDAVPMLSFVVAGILVVMEASKIAKIEYTPGREPFCAECGQPMPDSRKPEPPTDWAPLAAVVDPPSP